MKKYFLSILIISVVLIGASCKKKETTEESTEQTVLEFYQETCDKLMALKGKTADMPPDSMLKITVEMYSDTDSCVQRNIKIEEDLNESCKKTEDYEECKKSIKELREAIANALLEAPETQ